MVMRAVVRCMALAVVVTVGAACDGDPFSPYWDRGTYELTAANDRYVPATVYSVTYPGRTDRVEVLSGWLTLRRDDSYELIVRTRESINGQVAEVTHAYAGHYDHEGRMLYLTYSLPRAFYTDELQATWRDGSIEVVLPDVAAERGVLMRFGR